MNIIFKNHKWQINFWKNIVVAIECWCNGGAYEYISNKIHLLKLFVTVGKLLFEKF